MPETLVYPQHPMFEPYRDLAASTELQVTYDVARDGNLAEYKVGLYGLRPIRVTYEHVPVTECPAFGQDPSMIVPVASDEMFWYENGGINTLAHNKIWPQGYVNEGYRISSRNSGQYDDKPQANEVLAFGVGALRPFRVEGKGFSSFLCETVQRIDSRRLRRLGAYVVDFNSGWDGNEWTGGTSYPLESTNLIMPETLGELQQLHERKDEADFMDAYLRDLVETTRFQLDYDGVNVPHCLSSIKPRWQAARIAHLKTGLWDGAPSTVSELNDRVEELLEHIVIDTEPIKVTHTPEPTPELLTLQEKYPDLLD